MKFLYLFLVSFFTVNVFSQKQLEPSFFVEVTSEIGTKGKIVTIKKYNNYDAYLAMRKLLKAGQLDGVSPQMIEKAYQATAIKLPKGSYLIDNQEHSFSFATAQNGMLSGEGIFFNKKKELKSVYKFLSGELVESQSFNTENKLVQKTNFSKETTESIFYKHGKMAQKIVTNNALTIGANQIIYSYHKNETLSKEQNFIKNTTKEFYQNGKLKLDKINGNSYTKYDSEGNITEKWYKTDKQSCLETYENGQLKEKKCDNLSTSVFK